MRVFTCAYPLLARTTDDSNEPFRAKTVEPSGAPFFEYFQATLHFGAQGNRKHALEGARDSERQQLEVMDRWSRDPGSSEADRAAWAFARSSMSIINGANPFIVMQGAAWKQAKPV